MSLLDNVDAEFVKFSHTDHIADSLSHTRDLINELESLYTQVQSAPATDVGSVVKKSTKKWEEAVRKNLKASNAGINKFSKALDRVEPLDDVYQYKIDKTPRNLSLVDNAVRLHLLREGDLGLDIGRVDVMNKFVEMNTILNELSRGELQSAIDWVTQHAKNTELEFMLHKAQFLQYYHQGEVFRAFEYAERWFPAMVKEAPGKLENVAPLIGSLLFRPIDAPKHSNVNVETQLTSTQLGELGLLFSRQFCSHIGFSFESSLFTILLAAHIAFPFFSKLQKIKTTQKIDWTSKDELPIEIHLPDSLKFHAIYICPVSKSETTRANPAMALPCHHVISKQALQNLCKGSGTLKCPYCPSTAMASQCIEVQFHSL